MKIVRETSGGGHSAWTVGRNWLGFFNEWRTWTWTRLIGIDVRLLGITIIEVEVEAGEFPSVNLSVLGLCFVWCGREDEEDNEWSF